MAAQKEVSTYIKLFGKVDSSFNEISKKLQGFGNTVSSVGGSLTMMSAPIAAAAKQSLDLYTDYDDVMKRIQAIGGYSEAQMKVISDSARQAGADTRYMALDAGNAFLYMTQAGIEMNETLDVMPTLLNAAAAGNMELATASDLLISNIYSLGKEFDNLDVSTYIDQVSTAADSTNTNLQEMMEGVSKVGAAGRMFGGGTEELLAFMGMLANLNLKGSTGGINARNMIISLLAPTEKASKMMDALAISEEEMGEALEDIDLTQSATAIKTLGLETVDARGKVRPMVDILTDLKSSIADMNDAEAANTLYTIFGKRTYPAVAGLMEMLDEYPELLEAIGDSSGAAARKAEILESGIGGSARRLKSALQELGLSAGEAMSDKAIEWMEDAREFILGIADSIGEMDPATIDALMDSFAKIAIAGPGLMIAGKAISGIGTAVKLLGTPGGKFIALALALGGLYSAYKAWDNAETENFLIEHFGSLEFNASRAQEIIDSLASEFETKAGSLTTYTDAITEASDAYQGAVDALSGGLLESYFAQTDLTELDKQDLLTLAGNMAAYLQEAMQQEKIYLGNIIDLAFDGSNEGDTEKNAAWSSFVDTLFGDLETEAAAASEELRSAMVEALKDGNLSEDELEAIRASQTRMNTIMAEIAAINSEYDASLAYNKVMYMSYDSLEEHMAALDEARKASDAATGEHFASLATAIDLAEAHGTEVDARLQTLYGIGATDYEGARAAVRAEWNDQLIDNRLDRDEYGARVTSQYFADFGNELDPFYAMLDQYMNGEDVSFDDAMSAYKDATGNKYNKKDAKRFGENVLGAASSHLSYEDLVADMERQIATTGTVSDDLFGAYRNYMAAALYSSIGDNMANAHNQQSLSPVWEGNRDIVDSNGNFIGTLDDYMRYASYVGNGQTIPVQVELTPSGEELAAELSDIGENMDPIEAPVVAGGQSLPVDVSLGGESVDVEATMSPDAYTAATTYGTEIQAGLDDTGAEISIGQPDGAGDGKVYASDYQRGINNNKPSISVTKLDGYTAGNVFATEFQNALDDYEFKIDVAASGAPGGMQEYATGGRATSASIFAEAGPEWAIPEEHSQRTAELLASAARASGFTAKEIAERTGGLNGNTTVAPQFIFAPTIHANDGPGVKAALDKGKAEMEAWWEELQRRMERVSYQ